MSFRDQYVNYCTINRMPYDTQVCNLFETADFRITDLSRRLDPPPSPVIDNHIEEMKSQFENPTFKGDLDSVLHEVAEIILDKNRKYGNSALAPKRIFSDANPIEQIKVRIDDKLSRLENQQSDDYEDAEFDLLGYLILLRIARKQA